MPSPAGMPQNSSSCYLSTRFINRIPAAHNRY